MSKARGKRPEKKPTFDPTDAEVSACYQFFGGRELTMQSLITAARNLGQELSPDEASAMLEFAITKGGTRAGVDAVGFKALVDHLRHPKQ